MDITYGINTEEKEVARKCLEYALKHGAQQARVSLSKSTLDSFMMLNGEFDKLTHCTDRSIYIYLFVDGKYGTYSTNRLNDKDIEDFVLRAVENTRMLAPDEFRRLPEAERCATNALSGRELGLYDGEYEQMSADRRLALAAGGSRFKTFTAGEGYSIISEECEYSDSIDDNYLIDSQGFEGRHAETSFAFWSEITIEDDKGHKYSGYEWTSSPFFKDIDIVNCSEAALRKAVRQIAPKKHKGGRFTMVVDNTVSSRLIAPVFQALNAASIQQKNSFLEDSIGRKLFPAELTVQDLALSKGKPGARLFDTEGVATQNRALIEDGVVRFHFTNTYIAGKTGTEPTIEGISRPCMLPFIKKGEDLIYRGNGINLQSVLEEFQDGIYITGFNGGNCNPTTGNFSYGVEGFAFRKGAVTHPVREMVITGDMLGLWASLVAVGDDARSGARWQIPTLAFAEVDFSA